MKVISIIIKKLIIICTILLLLQCKKEDGYIKIADYPFLKDTIQFIIDDSIDSSLKLSKIIDWEYVNIKKIYENEAFYIFSFRKEGFKHIKYFDVYFAYLKSDNIFIVIDETPQFYNNIDYSTDFYDDLGIFSLPENIGNDRFIPLIPD